MTRVTVVVEGQTEEAFVTRVLAPTLQSRQVYLAPVILGAPGHKGGNPKYQRVKRDVVIQLKQDQTAFCSTMLDFYGLGRDFPGMPLPPNLAGPDKVIRIERAVKEDIVAELPELRPDLRFLPYLQLHEFEGLLFSQPAVFAVAIGQEHLGTHFTAVRNEFATPEDINDDPNTAPSKRVLRAYPGYKKVIDGTLAAEAVGVARMRAECPHFRGWLEQLEGLGA